MCHLKDMSYLNISRRFYKNNQDSNMTANRVSKAICVIYCTKKTYPAIIQIVTCHLT